MKLTERAQNILEWSGLKTITPETVLQHLREEKVTKKTRSVGLKTWNELINYSGFGGISKPLESNMALRDYFAGQWLSGLGSYSGVVNVVNEKHIAEGCYNIADAMLKARKAPSGLES